MRKRARTRLDRVGEVQHVPLRVPEQPLLRRDDSAVHLHTARVASAGRGYKFWPGASRRGPTP